MHPLWILLDVTPFAITDATTMLTSLGLGSVILIGATIAVASLIYRKFRR